MRIATLNIQMKGPGISKKLIRIIREHNIKVLCVQECPRATAAAVKCNNSEIYTVSHRGLSIFSFSPITLIKKIDLGRYYKAAMMVRICGHSIVNLHLDHLSENLRLKQASRILQEFKNAHYIVGDFNSLQEQDYTTGQWNSIQNSRQAAKLEQGASKVMNKFGEAGYHNSTYVAPTTLHSTRVDYILKTSTVRTENVHILFSDHDMVIEIE